VERLPTGEVVPRQQALAMTQEAEAALRPQEGYQPYLQSRLEMTPGYAEVCDCRREYLLNYLTEHLEKPCGFCDNCKTGVVVEEDSGAKPFPLNSLVRQCGLLNPPE
jgi:ATP-dependent DNA helicase RecQ